MSVKALFLIPYAESAMGQPHPLLEKVVDEQCVLQGQPYSSASE